MKSTLVAYLLLLFLGGLGIHRFYLGRPISGIFYLLTLGGFGIGCLIDLFLVPGMVRQENAKMSG